MSPKKAWAKFASVLRERLMARHLSSGISWDERKGWRPTGHRHRDPSKWTPPPRAASWRRPIGCQSNSAFNEPAAVDDLAKICDEADQKNRSGHPGWCGWTTARARVRLTIAGRSA